MVVKPKRKTKKTSISKDTVGTLIDAIYAIAVTIPALEIPGEFKNDFVVGSFAEMQSAP